MKRHADRSNSTRQLYNEDTARHLREDHDQKLYNEDTG